MQDLDAVAGHISYAHCGMSEDNVTSGDITAVTASCDRIDLLAPLPVDVDMLMLGCCTCVWPVAVAPPGWQPFVLFFSMNADHMLHVVGLCVHCFVLGDTGTQGGPA